jgi:hypothetical protein
MTEKKPERRIEKHVICADLKLCLQHAHNYEEILEQNNIKYQVNHFFFSKGELKATVRGFKVITFDCDETYPVKVFKINPPKPTA